MKRRYLAILTTLILAAVLVIITQWPALALQSNISPEDNVQPSGIDLDVTFIHRDPMYQAYCVTYPWDIPGQPGIPSLCPGTETEQRWPEYGEVVTFTAHILNKGTLLSPAFDYAWSIDGAQVATGTLPGLSPTQEITATYHWVWAHTMSADGQRVLDDHTVGFTADPENSISETYESNNSLEDQTAAMSFGITITPEMYAAYNVPVTDTLPFSAEDWLQKQIARMNQAFKDAGSGARVRINRLEIADFPSQDRTHDGHWFVDADYRHGASGYYDPVTDIDWGLIHELGHQMALIDLYASNIYPTNVFVQDRQGRATNFGFEWSSLDLMNDPGSQVYGSHTAGGAASNIGYRNGYYGAYQFDIPQNNYLLILDSQGNPAPGVQLALYQRQGPWDWTGHTGIDNSPEITGTTGVDGWFLLPNRSANGGTVTATGHVMHDNPFGVVDINGVQNRFLLHITTPDHEEFHWMDVTDFNLAYWAGDILSHTYTISSHVPSDGAPASPEISVVQAEYFTAHLCWNASTDAVGYIIYRADPPDFRYQVVSETLSGLCYDENFPDVAYGAHIYTLVAVDGNGRESGFSSPVWIPDVFTPVSLAVTPDQERIVLSYDNWYGLSLQSETGRYLQNLGSVHYHLDNSQYIALDMSDRLLISHPADPYTTTHSVWVATPGGDPLFKFGEYGSGPGQFDTPTGVAAWGEACGVEGPLPDDGDALLLLHFDGSYTGVQGKSGTASGTGFMTGKYSQGVLIDASDTLTYTASGDFIQTQGAVEFWVRPDWDGNDGQNYVLLEVGNPDTWENRLRITKDGGNNLRLIVYNGTGAESGVTYNVADWQAGDWHHVAATWEGGDIILYVDCVSVASANNAQLPDSLPATIYIGSSAWRDAQANVVIDELRISSDLRVGNSDMCNRLLVADSGNNRLQAFDPLGNFLSAYEMPDGEVQFNDPQGMAVDNKGRVLVVDRGNNRVVVLSFDSLNFTYLQTFTAGFNSPTAVAVDSRDHIFVADTGNNRIVELDPAGFFLAEYTEPNDGYNGAFNAPCGVAVTNDGTIIVADTGNHRVVTIKPDWGTYLPFLRR